MDHFVSQNAKFLMQAQNIYKDSKLLLFALLNWFTLVY